MSRPADKPVRAPGILWFLAWRTFLGSRMPSVLTVAAIAAGVGFQVPNTANMLGYRDELVRQGVLSGFGDVRVRARKGLYIKSTPALQHEIAALANVASILPVLVMPGALSHKDLLSGASIIGLDLEAPRHPFVLSAGNLPKSPREILLGTGLAQKLGVGLHDTISIHVISMSEDPLAPVSNRDTYEVTVAGLASGTFGAAEAVFVSGVFLAQAMDRNDLVTAILVYAQQLPQAQELAQKINRAHPELRALLWSEDSPLLDSLIRSISAVNVLSSAMVLVAVGIPVWSLLYVNVFHRRREIALLSAMGFARSDIFLLFFAYATLLGLLGCGLGGAIGYGLVRFFTSYPIFKSTSFVISPAVTAAVYLKPALLVLLGTWLAALYPAWTAAAVDPATELRGEK